MHLLGVLIGLGITSAMVILPAMGIGDKYGASAGWAIFVLSAGISSISYWTGEIFELLKKKASTEKEERRNLEEQREKEFHRWKQLDSRLQQIENSLSSIKEYALKALPAEDNHY